AGYAKGFRLARRHLQRQRFANSWGPTDPAESPEPGYRERERGGSRHAALGDLVPADLSPRYRRREDRAAKHRPGIHAQPIRRPVHQFDVWLSRGTHRRHDWGWAPISAFRAWRAASLEADRQSDAARQRVRRQSGGARYNAGG